MTTGPERHDPTDDGRRARRERARYWRIRTGIELAKAAAWLVAWWASLGAPHI